MPQDLHGNIYCKSTENLIYRGGIREGKRFGKGIEFYNSMNQRVLFRGDYYENFRHGKGIEYEIDETVSSVGIWEYGRRQDVQNIDIASSNVLEWLNTDNKKQATNVINQDLF